MYIESCHPQKYWEDVHLLRCPKIGRISCLIPKISQSGSYLSQVVENLNFPEGKSDFITKGWEVKS